MQKHVQFHYVSFGEYVTDNSALWLDLRMIDENTLHGTGRKIGSSGGGGEITLHIEKKCASIVLHLLSCVDDVPQLYCTPLILLIMCINCTAHV